jgi:glycerol-3-phosphate acyltransferase PlsY
MWLLGARAVSCLAAGAVAVLIIARHRENLRRLIAGRERRLGAPRA